MVLVFAGLRGFRYPMGSYRLDLLWEMLCLSVGLVGLLIRCLTIGYAPPGTSGRGTQMEKATRLSTSGMYSIVRHPLYLGNYFFWLAVAMLPRSWWVVLLVTLVFWVFYERIMFAEEEVLREKFGAAFLAWAERTPAFVPALRSWVPPEYPYNFRGVLRREPTALFGLVLAILAVEAVADVVATGSLNTDPFWVIVLVSTTLLYSVARLVTKKTRILHVAGR
jgi:protein-S-isoprenylcysteine O-methyltransferase Ste14